MMSHHDDRQLRNLLQRLHQVIEQETGVLGRREFGALEDITKQKSQLLFELAQMSRKAPVADDKVKHLLEPLKRALNENQRQIGLHMQAARELTDCITSAMRQDQSDGTYGYGGYSDD